MIFHDYLFKFLELESSAKTKNLSHQFHCDFHFTDHLSIRKALVLTYISAKFKSEKYSHKYHDSIQQLILASNNKII